MVSRRWVTVSGVVSVVFRTRRVAAPSTMASSRSVEVTSSVPMVSGCQGWGPNGSPTVRVRVHRMMVAAFPMAPAMRRLLVGR